MILFEEGWQARQHFVEQHPKSPPIDRASIAVSEDQLRCEVFGRTRERCDRSFTEVSYSPDPVLLITCQVCVLFVLSPSVMLSLHNPKSHSIR